MVFKILPISLLFTFHLSFSQVTFGVKGGGQIADLILNDAAKAWFNENNYDFRPSYHAGIFSNFVLGNRSSLRAELLYADKGCKGGGSNLHLVYLNLPVLYQYNFSQKLGVQGGGEFGCLLSSYYYRSAVKRTSKDQFGNTFDIGLSGGLVFQISPSIHVSARYTQGLFNIISKNSTLTYSNSGSIGQIDFRDAGMKFRNQCLQLSLEYTLLE